MLALIFVNEFDQIWTQVSKRSRKGDGDKRKRKKEVWFIWFLRQSLVIGVKAGRLQNFVANLIQVLYIKIVL